MENTIKTQTCLSSTQNVLTNVLVSGFSHSTTRTGIYDPELWSSDFRSPRLVFIPPRKPWLLPKNLYVPVYEYKILIHVWQQPDTFVDWSHTWKCVLPPKSQKLHLMTLFFRSIGLSAPDNNVGLPIESSNAILNGLVFADLSECCSLKEIQGNFIAWNIKKAVAW